MLTLILEAAFRSMLMALAVWACIRLLRVQAVLAQKVAWALVLVAAGTMPMVMHLPWLALDRMGFQALRIPVRSLPGLTPGRTPQTAQTPAATEPVSTTHFARIAKPSPEHPALQSDGRFSISFVPVEHAAPAARVSADAGSQPVSALSFATPLPAPGSAAMPGGAELWSWPRIKLILGLVYLAVGGVLLLRTLAGLCIACWVWSGSRPVANLADGALSASGTATLRPRSIRTSARLTTPVTIGSTVVLPADFRQWDTAKLRIVLAHEQSHVRQGDFYLQLLAAIHVAVFWFSPLGWWLQRKLSELGEALSDRAGLEQASDATSYAQVLLEFAAMPRKTPIAGVAMARSSNVSSRIERILNARRFRMAFLGGGRHAILAAVIVPAALAATVACIRIVPAVEAAPKQTASPASPQASGTAVPPPASGQATGVVSGQVSGQVSGSAPDQVDQVTSVDSDQVTPPAIVVAPVAPVAPNPPSPVIAPMPTPVPVPEPAPRLSLDMAPGPPTPPQAPENSSIGYSNGDDEGSFAIIRGNGNVTLSGHAGKELEEAKRKYHNNFLWFEHDGKSYVITDPAILAQAQSLLKGNPSLEVRKAQLDRMQAQLNEEMAKMRPEIDRASQQGAEMQTKMAELQRKLAQLQLDKISEAAAKAFPPEEQAELNKQMAELAPELAKIKVPGPEFDAQMAKLQAQLAELQSEKFKKLTDDMSKQFSEEKLEELQEKIGDMQGSIGEIQGEIGERQGRLGERQGELGERIGRIGEEMGRIGEQQGRDAEAASRRMRSVLDQAMRNGKAVPLN